MKKAKKNNTKGNTDYSSGSKKSREQLNPHKQLNPRDTISSFKNDESNRHHDNDNDSISHLKDEELLVHDTSNTLSNEELNPHKQSSISLHNPPILSKNELDYHDKIHNGNKYSHGVSTMHINPYNDHRFIHDNNDNQSVNTLESSRIPHIITNHDNYSVSILDSHNPREPSNDACSVNALEHSNRNGHSVSSVHTAHSEHSDAHNVHDTDSRDQDHLNPHDMLNNQSRHIQSNNFVEKPQKHPESINSALNLTEQDIYRETTSQTIVMATMYNYDNIDDNVSFFEKNMNEINMTYNDLLRLFFSDAGGAFNSSVVNYVWTGINKFSLSSYLLDKYEQTSGTSRDQMSPVAKIYLYKESNIQKFSRIIKKTFSINLNELNVAFNSVVPRQDGSINVMIVLNLFFKSVNIYTRFNVRFQISGIPAELLGNCDQQEDDNITFNFNELLVNNDCYHFN